jgi:hypothetical protein
MRATYLQMEALRVSKFSFPRECCPKFREFSLQIAFLPRRPSQLAILVACIRFLSARSTIYQPVLVLGARRSSRASAARASLFAVFGAQSASKTLLRARPPRSLVIAAARASLQTHRGTSSSW